MEEMSSGKTYVDNAYNRRLGRVGLPQGSAVVSRSSSRASRAESPPSSPFSHSGCGTYVDNSYNRKLGRVGMEYGTAVVSRSSKNTSVASDIDSIIYGDDYPSYSSCGGASSGTYVDNTYNRKLGRVGMEYGTAVVSKSSKKSSVASSTDFTTYVDDYRGSIRGASRTGSETDVDDSHNGRLDHVGMVTAVVSKPSREPSASSTAPKVYILNNQNCNLNLVEEENGSHPVSSNLKPRSATLLPATPRPIPSVPAVLGPVPLVPAVPRPVPLVPDTPRPIPLEPTVPRPMPLVPAVPRPIPLVPATPRPVPLVPAVPRPVPLVPATPRPIPLEPTVPRPMSLVPAVPRPIPLVPAVPRPIPLVPTVPRPVPLVPAIFKPVPSVPATVFPVEPVYEACPSINYCSSKPVVCKSSDAPSGYVDNAYNGRVGCVDWRRRVCCLCRTQWHTKLWQGSASLRKKIHERNSSKLEHKNIVKMFGVVMEKEDIGIVMDYCKKTDALFVYEEDKFTPSDKLCIIEKLVQLWNIFTLMNHILLIETSRVKIFNATAKLCDFVLSVLKNTITSSRSTRGEDDAPPRQQGTP